MEERERYENELEGLIQSRLLGAEYTRDPVRVKHDAYTREGGIKKLPDSLEELFYQEQIEAYQKLLDEMMDLHIRKIKDYGPDAVKVTGEIGLIVRMWDKMARLLHLSGWDLKSGTKAPVKSPTNESIDDTLMDLASYALIMLVYRQGKWGK